MAQQLRALITLPEGLPLSPVPHGGSQPSLTLGPGAPTASSNFCRLQAHMVHLHTCGKTCINLKKTKYEVLWNWYWKLCMYMSNHSVHMCVPHMWKSSNWTRLPGQQAPGAFLYWDYKCRPPHQLLNWVLEVKLSSSCLYGKHFAEGAISLGPS